MRRSKRARPPNNKVETRSFELSGGLNLVDSPITIPAGMGLAATNYELLPRKGIRRIDGYERSDGQPRPSDATYHILNYDVGSVTAPVDDAWVTGLTSGARGKVGSVVLSTGSWAGNNAAGYLVIFTITGTFVNNESLTFTADDDGFSHGFSSGFG